VVLSQGDIPAIRDTLKRLEQLLPNSEPSLVLKARLAIRENHPNDAEVPLEKLLAANPNSPVGNFLLGAVKAQQGNLSEAQTFLTVAANANPNDLRVRKLLADVELRQGKSHEVLELAGAASESKDIDMHSLAGKASMKAGNSAAAIEYFERSRDL